MLALLEIGRRLGIRHQAEESESERSNLGTVEAAVFALFGLVLAFTFSGAADRFNQKRALIAEEGNAIGTAYLRLQLLSEKVQPELQELFRHYLDSRVETYRKLPNMQAAEIEMAKTKKIQREIWTKAITATTLQGSHPDAGKLLLPALNSMIDITTTRNMALRTHPPNIIFALLFALGLICSLLAGYRMATSRRRSWLHMLSFILITVIVIYVIVDVEYPRAGLIRLESFDQVMIDARADMN